MTPALDRQELAGWGLRFANGQLSYKTFRNKWFAQHYASKLYRGAQGSPKAKVIAVVIMADATLMEEPPHA